MAVAAVDRRQVGDGEGGAVLLVAPLSRILLGTVRPDPFEMQPVEYQGRFAILFPSLKVVQFFAKTISNVFSTKPFYLLQKSTFSETQNSP